MNYREPAYDDTVCDCGRPLPDTVHPWTWPDHGFCAVACAASCTGAFDVRGTEPVLELARLGTGRGPGFEESLIRGWREALTTIPHGLLWLAKRHGPDDPTRASAGSWAWRVYLTDTRGTVVPQCVAFRLTPKEHP
jgi:hypothetical protein